MAIIKGFSHALIPEVCVSCNAPQFAVAADIHFCKKKVFVSIFYYLISNLISGILYYLEKFKPKHINKPIKSRN